MSLFDRITPKDSNNNNNSGTAKSGLGGGLFGNTSTTQPQQQQQTGAQTTGSNLFGAPSTAPKPSLFGATSTTQPAQATQPAGSNLLGGGATAGSQAAVPNGSLFQSGFLPKGDENQKPGPSDPNAPAPQPGYFDALLQRGKKRQKEEKDGFLGDLPQLELGLQDLSRKVRNLGQGGPSAGAAKAGDARGHYLLSASGVNTSQTLRDLSDLNGSTTVASHAAADKADTAFSSGVKETLAQRYQNDFQKMVSAHVERAQDDFNKMIDEKLHGVDWTAHRQRIHEHFGLKKPSQQDNTTEGTTQDAGSFGRSSRRSRLGPSTMNQSFGLAGMSKSVIGNPGLKASRMSTFTDIAADGIMPAPEDRVLRMKQEKYINKVKELNVARLQERAFPVLSKFSEVEQDPANDNNSMLVHAYKAIARIVGEDPTKERLSDPGVIKERQYAPDYLEDENKVKSTQMRRRILNGSRQLLEELAYGQLETMVARNPREAKTGGVPTAIAKVKGYVRVRASRKELGVGQEELQTINGDYCWVVLFYLIRNGLLHEALEYLDENAAAFKQIDRSFVRYLRAYVANEDRRLPAEMQTAISNEYKQRKNLDQTVDPYRQVCYRIVGRIELNKRSLDGINTDMMDWIWLQLALAREYSRVEEFAQDAFGLDELRASITEVGERYFGPGSDIANAPSTFFFLQVLVGLFEKAVADLYVHNYVSATHFAIGLDFYGLLRVSDIGNSDSLLSFTTRSQPQLAFGSMLGLYTRDFRAADASAAADYLTLICLNGDLTGNIGKKQREVCHRALTELVLETREFAQLLGDIRGDGQRIKGAIEQRLRLIGLDNEQEFLKYITQVAARTAEEQSRTTDAALLFHLAEDYDKVIQVVNEAQSLALLTELGEQPARLTPLKPRAPEKGGNDAVLTSLSLTAVDDPIDLARNMTQLYGSARMYYSKIKQQHSDACLVLLRLADARNALEKGDWALVIDHVTHSRLLPTSTEGSLPAIRSTAAAFAALPAVVARTVGHVMLWTVLACSRNVDRLKDADFETGAQKDAIARCVQTSKDVLCFAGLIRYQLPGRVWEGLVRAGAEVGAY